jgi:CHASE3 domain sensor protein
MNTRWTIGKKLSIGCAAMLVTTLLMGIASQYASSSLNSELEFAIQNTARQIQLGGEIDVASSDMLASQRGIILFAYAKRPDHVQKAKSLFADAVNQWQKVVAEIQPLLVNEEGRRFVRRAQEQLTAWRAIIIEVQQSADRGEADAATRIAITKALPIYEANSRDIDAFREL